MCYYLVYSFCLFFTLSINVLTSTREDKNKTARMLQMTSPCLLIRNSALGSIPMKRGKIETLKVLTCRYVSHPSIHPPMGDAFFIHNFVLAFNRLVCLYLPLLLLFSP